MQEIHDQIRKVRQMYSDIFDVNEKLPTDYDSCVDLLDQMETEIMQECDDYEDDLFS